jgi:cell division septation protein DedD
VKSRARQRLIAVLLVLLMAAIASPLLWRAKEVTEPPPRLHLPAEPVLPATDRSAPVSQAEQERIVREVERARAAVGTPSVQGSAEVERSPRAWAVSVARVVSEDQAHVLSGQLRDQGYRAFVRPLSASAWQVFAGPELELARAQALQERLRLEGLVGEGAEVVPFTP